MVGNSPQPETSNSYARIVTQKHFERLQSHLENAKSLNAKLDIGGDVDVNSKYIAPTIVSGVSDEASLLNEEIFGPILPIVTYKTLDEAITYINSKERPLALYIYSNSKRIISTRRGSWNPN